MLDHFDRRLNAIFATKERLRKEEVKGGVPSSLLADALAESCILLQDMLADEHLGGFRIGEASVRTLRKLDRDGQLDGFLNAERKLLEMTKLNTLLVDELEAVMRRVIRSTEPPLDGWQPQLEMLKDQVCQHAKSFSQKLRTGPLLKRVLVAGGGGLLALLNSFPPVPMPQNVATLSISVGVWCVGGAAGNQLDDFFGP